MHVMYITDSPLLPHQNTATKPPFIFDAANCNQSEEQTDRCLNKRQRVTQTQSSRKTYRALKFTTGNLFIEQQIYCCKDIHINLPSLSYEA